MRNMLIQILYHPHSEHARQVEQYKRDFERSQNTGEIELVSLETRDGADIARLYDIVRYPAVLAITETDKKLMKLWQDEKLPLMSEVASYARR
jgi:hypothetical protein